MKVSYSPFHINKQYRYIISTVLAVIVFYFLSFYASTLISTNPHWQLLLQSSIFLICFISFLLFLKYLIDKEFAVAIKNTEETIKRYDALSNATNDAIWDYDMITEKVFYNERLMTIFGYSKEELSNNTTWWEKNIHADDKERVMTRMNNLLEKNKTTWEDEYRFRCKNGDYKIVFDRSYIVRDKNQKPLRLIGAMKDVTQIRTLEKQIVNKQLKEKNVLGKKIIVSHENERRKIKDELHEDVNQLLASIKIYISTNKDNNENLSQSLVYLDDVMFKINKISNSLYSSTFEMLGFEEAIHELFEKCNKNNNINFALEIDGFNEEQIEKNTLLYLYRIIENRLNCISTNLQASYINVELFNIEQNATLKIYFNSKAENAEAILNDTKASDINVKLEMYEGKMKLIAAGEGDYMILVVI
jgi:two-component system, NarL family, sensor histidine kinase UhpB